MLSVATEVCIKKHTPLAINITQDVTKLHASSPATRQLITVRHPHHVDFVSLHTLHALLDIALAFISKFTHDVTM
jgi:hypothetical protein